MTVKLSSFPWSFQGQPSGGRPALPGSVRSAGRRSIAIPARRVRACSSSTMRRPRGLDLIWRMSPSASASQRWFDARAALTGSPARGSARSAAAQTAPRSASMRHRDELRVLQALDVTGSVEGDRLSSPGRACERPGLLRPEEQARQQARLGIGAEDRRDRPSLSSHIPDISSPFAWISRSRRGTPHAARICLPPRPAVGESALPPICSVAADGLPITVGVKEWQICAAVRTHT
jgi:hypothetical protein